MTTHLILPDSHVQPGTSNERFDWLGKFILERKPDKIICLGDFADMNSLSSYDRGKRNFEGRRYRADCEAVHDALDKLHKPVNDFNIRQRKNGKAQYRPKLLLTLGNHEERIIRATQDRAELDGTIGIEDLRYEEFGWAVFPYLDVIQEDGVYYSHFYSSGVKGEAISGMNVASSILARQMVSCTAGHIHLLDFAVRSTPSGKKVMGLVPGCYIEAPQDYAHHTEHLWWRGIAWCEDVMDGAYDLELISMERLKKIYGT